MNPIKSGLIFIFLNIFLSTQPIIAQVKPSKPFVESKGSVNTVDDYPPWVNTMNLYEINPYSWNSGDGVFSNVTNDLDRLVNLGINTIWFTPIFESLGEGMGYWTYDYYEIYSGFGTKDDFKDFVDAAHDKGIKVILDLVFNHTGRHHPFFQSCLDEKSESPYADYYIWDGEAGTSNYEYFYDWDQLPNLNVINPDVEEYLIGVAEYWLENFDIDGYRADVAWGIELRSDVFWKNFNTRLRNIKPEIFLLGEGPAKPVPGSLEGNPSGEHDKSILFDDRFNSAYDWELRNWNPDVGLPGLLKGDIRINDLNNILMEEYPEGAFPLRFIENHDHPRAAALFDLERSKLAHTLVFTVPGIPLLYCGAETGQTEQFWSLGADPGGVQPYFQKLVQTRRGFVSNDGEIEILPNSEPDDIYSYATISEDKRVIVTALNFNGSEQQFTMDLSSLVDGGQQNILLRDILNERNYVVNPAYLSDLPVNLDGYEARVYVFNPVENLLINGDFDSGIFPWYMYVNEAAGASASINNNAIKIDVTGPGSIGWHIQLIQSNLPVEQNEIYELSFVAATDQDRNVNVIIGEDGGNYAQYFNETIGLSESKNLYQLYFTMSEATDLNARFVIELGGESGDVMIDGFKLRKKGAVSGIKVQNNEKADRLELVQNYPNPFNKRTKISFNLGCASIVELNFYNLDGGKVSGQNLGQFNEGNHEVYFDRDGLPSGYYIYEIKTKSGSQRKLCGIFE